MEHSRFALVEHEQFLDWLRRLPCLRTRLAIVRRLDRLRLGRAGAVQAMGKGVFAMPLADEVAFHLFVHRRGAQVTVLHGCAASSRFIEHARHAIALAHALDSRMPHGSRRRFDAADHLDTPQARALYLRLALEGDDVSEIVEALAAIARATGVTDTVKRPGARRESLHKSLGAAGGPELATLLRVLKALGLRLSAAPRD
jgi:probable addiction module antidote protein